MYVQGQKRPLNLEIRKGSTFSFSFKLVDAETLYVNSERECLAAVRCLSEVKWLVTGSYPVMLYYDHIALRDIFTKADSKKARINAWLDWLGEFDLKLVYKSSTDQHIGIAGGLSSNANSSPYCCPRSPRRKVIYGYPPSSIPPSEDPCPNQAAIKSTKSHPYMQMLCRHQKKSMLYRRLRTDSVANFPTRMAVDDLV